MSEPLITLPKPKIDAVGTVTHRCADCNEMIEDEPWFSDGTTFAAAFLYKLTPEVRSYHKEHVPYGR